MPLLGAPSQASLTAHLRAVPRSLPKPKAIIAVTAHWEVGLIYDWRLIAFSRWGLPHTESAQDWTCWVPEGEFGMACGGTLPV